MVGNIREHVRLDKPDFYGTTVTRIWGQVWGPAQFAAGPWCLLGRMADIVDVQTRSRMMAGIRARDTRPEMLLRKALHARGYRYRLCDKRLPGKPDMVFPRFRAVIFVHGCFWHGHEACRLFRLPKSNTAFWQGKIAAKVGASWYIFESCGIDDFFRVHLANEDEC